MNPNGFENRVALVTGRSRVIGRAVCLELAWSGARVAVNYAANREAAEETLRLVSEQGGTAALYQADVGAEEEIAGMFDRIEADVGVVSGRRGRRRPGFPAARISDAQGFGFRRTGASWRSTRFPLRSPQRRRLRACHCPP